MKRFKIAVSLLMAVVMGILAITSGMALTSTEKENKYSAALEELKSYLESPEESRDGVMRLSAIMADLEELGNYSLSHELYCYAYVLLKIEEGSYDDWRVGMYLEQLRKSEKLSAFIKRDEDGVIGDAEALSAYLEGRKAEAEQDFEAAIGQYDLCLSFFDAMLRQSDLMETRYADAYHQAETLMNEKKYEEAYVLFKTCRQYMDAEYCMSYIVTVLGYEPGVCGDAHTWEETITKAATCKDVGEKQLVCSVCGKTETEALPITEEHQWLEATDEAPKTCSVCGKTEGEPLPKTKKGDIITFGAYEEDNDLTNGKEPIEWLVLEVDKSTNRVLLLSRYGLDARRFDASTYQGWDKSEIRSWLNSTFLNAAFTAEEQKAIATTTVKTGNNDEWVAFAKKYGWSYDNLNGGADTQDKVFLLSLEEAMAYSGYSTLDNFTFNGTDKMKAVPTKYAVAQGAYQYDNSDSNRMLNGTGCCWWWLRSPGSYSSYASYVYYDGSLDFNYVNYASGSVRPAFWLNLDSIIP